MTFKTLLAYITTFLICATNAAQFAEFVARCPFSHRLPDDPIVYPNRPGVSHLHDFFGSTVTSAHTVNTLDYFNGGTTCNPVSDKTPYWMPSLVDTNGFPITARATFYYQNRNIGNLTSIRRLPFGLRMIAGNATATAASTPRRTHWGCQGENKADANIVQCAANNPNLEAYIRFPECWNGVDLDSADHRSHMAYANGATEKCPATHPVALPVIEFKMLFPSTGGPGVRLSSGSGLTLHADVWIAWDECEQEMRILNCIRKGKKCAENGLPSDGSTPTVTTAAEACRVSGITPVTSEETPVEEPVEEDPVEEDPVEEDPIEEDPVEEDPVEEPVEEEPTGVIDSTNVLSSIDTTITTLQNIRHYIQLFV